MSVQEIAISHNQRKKLLKAIPDESVLFIEEESNDLVLSVDSYVEFKANKDSDPITTIIGDNSIKSDTEFVVFT